MEEYFSSYSNKDLGDIMRSMDRCTHGDIMHGDNLASKEWKKFKIAFPHTQNPGSFNNSLKMIIVSRFLKMV